MNRLGVHAGLWGFDWSAEGAERAIAGASAARYDLIEIPAVDRSTHDVTVTRRLLDAYGLDAIVSLALGFDDDINTVDPETSSRGEFRLLEAVAFAQEIGASLVTGVTYSAMGRYDRVGSEKGRLNSLAVLRRTADAAARSGVALGLEYVNRYESNLLNTAAQTVEFLSELDADNVLLHLDTFHAHLEEVDVTDPVSIAGARLGYVHASESHRGALGTGAIDWRRFARALADAQYHGPVTVETFSRAIVNPDRAADLGLWRTLWRDADAVAAESYSFLYEQLRAPETSLTGKETK